MIKQKTLYTLCSKNIPLVDFYSIFDKASNVSMIQISNVYYDNVHLFPKGFNLFMENGMVTSDTLCKWMDYRTVSTSRVSRNQIESAVRFAGSANPAPMNDPYRSMYVTAGVSLNDSLWFCEYGRGQTWEQVNPYTHFFNKKVSDAAFNGRFDQSCEGLSLVHTAESQTSGLLRKKWEHDANNTIVMRKGDDNAKTDGRSQVTMEYYAGQVAQAMGIPHIDYDLDMSNYRPNVDMLTCVCPLFTSESVGYVPACEYFAIAGLAPSRNMSSKIDTQKYMADLFGKEFYADMMVFDALILNIDRHMNNFGYLYDLNTGHLIGAAPLFDHGKSLMFDISVEHIEMPLDDIMPRKGRYMEFDEAVRIFGDERHLDMLEKIEDFAFKPHPDYPLRNNATEILNELIHYRGKTIKKIIRKKK